MGLSVKSKQKTHVAWDYGSSRNTVELHPQDASIQTICSCCRTQVSNGLTEKGLQILSPSVYKSIISCTKNTKGGLCNNG